MAGGIPPSLASGVCCDWCRCLIFSFLNRLFGSLGERLGDTFRHGFSWPNKRFSKVVSSCLLLPSWPLRKKMQGQLQQQQEGQAERPSCFNRHRTGGAQKTVPVSLEVRGTPQARFRSYSVNSCPGPRNPNFLSLHKSGILVALKVPIPKACPKSHAHL